jgi:hypothetical protein
MRSTKRDSTDQRMCLAGQSTRQGTKRLPDEFEGADEVYGTHARARLPLVAWKLDWDVLRALGFNNGPGGQSTNCKRDAIKTQYFRVGET